MNLEPMPAEELEKKIGYTFQDRDLLIEALTHSSYHNEMKSKGKGAPYNERLEFLGDSVLSIIVSSYLFERFRSKQEGDLTKIRAAVVCEKTLAEFARDIDLGSYIKLGHGEIVTNGRSRPSILSDAFEAVIAAIYLDGGIKNAEQFILPKIKNAIRKTMKKGNEDYKSRLQQIAQETPEELLEYVLVDEKGPPHDRVFTMEARLNSNVLGTGVGHSKREAEQMAAKEALKLFPVDENA